MANGVSSGSFSRQVERFFKKASKNIDDYCNLLIYEFVWRTVYKTAVGSPETWGNYWKSVRGVDKGAYKPGHLRANWQLTIGSPASQEVNGVDPTGGKTLSKARLALRGAGYTYYFYNTAPYAMEIELGGSNTTPAGMLRSTVAEWQAIAKATKIKVS